jgi:molybdate transport system substrate-binding protein
MLRSVKSWAGVLLAAIAVAGCASETQQPTTLKVAAADNLRPVMEDLARDYAARQPWIKFELHFANTAKLEQSLQTSAFDLYIPARAISVDALSDHGAIAPKSRYPIANNQLVIIAPEDSTLPFDITALTDSGVRQIAVVDPTGNMLGFLTHQSLTTLNYLPSHDSTPLVQPDNPPVNNIEPKLLVVPNEAAVLTAIKDGRAQIGISYSTYAMADKNVHILTPLSLDSYEPITYVTAIPRNAPNYEEAWNFLNYLRSPQARAIMQRDGLLVQ